MSTLKLFKEDFYRRMGGFDIFRGRKVLDLGCREGDDTLAIAQHAKEAVGLDIEQHLKWNQNNKKNVKFVVARAEELPFKTGEFDGLFIKDVLHHVNDLEKSLREIKRVTKGNAKIIIVEGNRYNPLFYIHMTKIGGHEHFPQGKFKKMILQYFPNARFLHFESHFVPGVSKPVFRLIILIEKAMDKVGILKPFLSYNVAIIN